MAYGKNSFSHDGVHLYAFFKMQKKHIKHQSGNIFNRQTVCMSNNTAPFEHTVTNLSFQAEIVDLDDEGTV